MRNRILEIVVFLMDFMRQHQGHQSSGEDLSSALKNMGYSEHEITMAYSWFLEKFDDTPEQYFSSFPSTHHSNRILTSSERSRISSDAYGCLIKLLNMALINDEQFEFILERAAIFESETIALDQIKLIASSIVFEDIDDFDSLPLFDVKSDQSRMVN